ncbi:MAG: cytochrome C [Sphingobium sp.]
MSGARIVMLAAAAVTLIAAAKPYALPNEPDIALPFAGEDADLVRANCSGCHSLDYITTQPRGKGVQFWRDSVTKMVNVYGAPVAKTDAERIAVALGNAR